MSQENQERPGLLAADRAPLFVLPWGRGWAAGEGQKIQGVEGVEGGAERLDWRLEVQKERLALYGLMGRPWMETLNSCGLLLSLSKVQVTDARRTAHVKEDEARWQPEAAARDLRIKVQGPPSPSFPSTLPLTPSP